MCIRTLSVHPGVSSVAGLCLGVLLSTSQSVAAQLPGPNPDPAEPDFTVVTLATTGQVPRHKFAFRLTHRFSRPLDGFEGDFELGELVENLFGFDSAAQIGLELRFGLLPGTQVGIHRTNDKTIQLFGQREVIRQGDSSPVAVDALVTVEGLNNFRKDSTTLDRSTSQESGRSCHGGWLDGWRCTWSRSGWPIQTRSRAL